MYGYSIYIRALNLREKEAAHSPAYRPYCVQAEGETGPTRGMGFAWGALEG